MRACFSIAAVSRLRVSASIHSSTATYARPWSRCLPWRQGGLARTPSVTDQSNSGYDYSIAAYLAAHGIMDYAALATIIALRPTGAKERAVKGVQYVLRTVTNALARHKWSAPSGINRELQHRRRWGS